MVLLSSYLLVLFVCVYVCVCESVPNVRSHSSQMLAFAFVLSEMSIFFSYDRCIINNTFECMQDWKRFVFHSNACLLLFCFAFVLSECRFLFLLFECMKDWKRFATGNKEVDRLKVLGALRCSFFFHLVLFMILCCLLIFVFEHRH